MTTILRELAGSPSTSRDASGKRTGTRRFFANTTSRELAEAAFFSEGWNAFPEDLALTFDRVDCQSSPNLTGVYVTASYSSFKAGRFSTTPPRDSSSYYSWLPGERDVKVDIPFSVLGKIVKGDGAQAQTLDCWYPAKATITETRILRRLKVRISGVTDTTIFDAVSKQKNRRHFILGQMYRFLGGTVGEGDGSYFDVTYTWEQDTGTPFPSDNIGRIDVEYDVISLNGVEYLRLPYADAQQLPSSNPLVFPYRNTQFVGTPLDANGWMSLPGSERIVS